MNKKGDEKIMSIWWFFVIVIISGGIIFGVLLYYGADVDVREIEANSLYNKLNECLVKGYQLNERLFYDDFDLFRECNINKELFGEGSDYYIQIIVEKPEGKIIGREMNYGQNAFEKDCTVGQNFAQDKFVRCYSSRIKTSYNGESVFLEITAASNQKGKRVNILK